MSIHRAVQIQRTWWNGFQREDVAALAALFANDATFWDPRFVPFAGRANIRLYYEDLFAKTTDYGGAHLGPYMFHDGAFAVWTRSKFRHRASGRLVDFPLVAFFTYRPSDGLVIAYEEYWDTAAVLRQLGISSFGAAPAFAVRTDLPISDWLRASDLTPDER